MQTFDGPVEATNALLDLLLDRVATPPRRIADRLRAALKERSPVVAVKNAVEVIYARQDKKEDVPEAIREWAAGAAVMAGAHGFHSMDQDDRGLKMAKVLRGQEIAAEERPEPDAASVAIAAPDMVAPAIDPAAPQPPAEPPAPAEPVAPETPPEQGAEQPVASRRKASRKTTKR